MAAQTNNSKKAFTFTPYGAIIQNFIVSSQDIVLGFSDPSEYAKANPCYFGAAIGRVANRLANASFSLNGKKYQLAANNGPCALHGGVVGWDKREWKWERSEAVEPVGEREGAWLDVFSLISEDGDEGYPGKVRCEVKYLQYREKFEGAEGGWREVLEIEFEAALVDEVGEEGKEVVEETVLNLTNHRYTLSVSFFIFQDENC